MFFIILSSLKVSKHGVFLFCLAFCLFLATFHLFYILKIFSFRFSLFFSVFFSVYIPFSSLSCFRSKISQFWFEVVLYISFSSFEFFVFKSFNFSFWWTASTSLFHLFVFSLIFPDENIILHHFFIAPGDFFEISVNFPFLGFIGCV